MIRALIIVYTTNNNNINSVLCPLSVTQYSAILLYSELKTKQNRSDPEPL